MTMKIISYTAPALIICGGVSLAVTQGFGYWYRKLDSEAVCYLLLYDNSNLNMIYNRIVYEAIVYHSHNTNRLT